MVRGSRPGTLLPSGLLHAVASCAKLAQLLVSIKGTGKKFVCKKFLPPMRGSNPGTLLSSMNWEVQFQDIVIEQKHDYNEKCLSHSRH